ncbi:MAG: hypothetical protein HY904_06480 [Deltaproteobacteria bacterium]|nr:hypothetical protein [Deltaproteobacteria bacterium]
MSARGWQGWLVAGALVAAGCTNRGGGTEFFTIKVDANPQTLPANPRESSVITVTVTGSAGKAPDAEVQVRATGGSLVDPAANGSSGNGLIDRVTARLNSEGVAELSFKCVSLANIPVSGNARVEATLLANGGNVGSPVVATPVTIVCTAVPDASSIAFTSPADGAVVTEPSRIPITIEVKDFDGSAPVSGNVVVSTLGTGVLFTLDETSTTPVTLPVALPATTGSARLYALYPGDDVTAAAAVPITLRAVFTSALTTSVTAELRFQYAQAPNHSSLKLVRVTSATGSPNITGTTGDFTATLAAGANSSDAVELEVEVVDRDGRSPTAPMEVEFSCVGAENNCQGFTGISPNVRDAGVLDNLRTAVVTTTQRPAAPNLPAATVATILFKAAPTSVADSDVSLSASFKPSNTSTSTIAPNQATVKFVNNDTISVTSELAPASGVIFSRMGALGNGTITVTMLRGTGGLPDREVCFTLDRISAARALLSDGSNDVNVDSLMTRTDATGKATVTVQPTSAVVRGPVTITVDAVDLPYDANRDATDQPCRTTDPSTKTLTENMTVDRAPVLASMVYLGASPSVLGVRSTSLPTTGTVQFQVFNDDNSPAGDVPVEFELDNNRDQTATVTPQASSNSTTGIVSAYIGSGEQAASLVVRATARRDQQVVTASSDPISVVGGKPAWAPMSIQIAGASTVFNDRAHTGYRDPFGGFARPAGSAINVQLVDRFSNRVARSGSGYQLQLRVESGSIPNVVTSDPDGFSTASYLPGPSFGLDTDPVPGESYSVYAYDRPHLDAPQDVFRIGNPQDGLISLLVATRGEESFVDSNGDGDYQVTEPFTDMPEPFLDKNLDGLRANCDLPADMLPIHHDVYRALVGIGTYCNPYYDDATEFPTPGLTAAECRRHWCPDWDRTWNCQDVLSSGGRTPETDRVNWCPHWRYRDTNMIAARINGSAGSVVMESVYDQSFVLGERNPDNGYVLMPGVDGLVIQDDTPTARRGFTSTSNERGVLTWSSTGGTRGSFRYKAPGDATAGSAVNVAPDTTSVELTSTGGRKAWVRTAPWLLASLTLPGGGAVASMDVEFEVIAGDLRAPFDDFARAQLRIAQTDQFIDGNDNGVWDDANGRFDTDTLIWKNLELASNSYPYFDTVDWSVPVPVVNGLPDYSRAVLRGHGQINGGNAMEDVVLYDRGHSFVHAIPDGDEENDSLIYQGLIGTYRDRMSTTDHSGGNDFFVVGPSDSVQIVVGFRDANGDAICAYGSTLVSVTPGDFTQVNLSSAGCEGDGLYHFALTGYFTEAIQVGGDGGLSIFGHLHFQTVYVTMKFDPKTGEGERVTTRVLHGLYYH